jgi:predicted RNase H-like nuclease (RuvC/YqgF family)
MESKTMADTFHVTGEDLFFRGYHVAKLLTAGVPATVQDAVDEALHAYHPDAIDPDEHKGDLDALEDAEGKVYDLTERVRELERELEDERDTVAKLQARVAALEEELEAFEAKAP